VDAQVIGRVEDAASKSLTIKTAKGEISF